jgi:hypothetical protein
MYRINLYTETLHADSKIFKLFMSIKDHLVDPTIYCDNNTIQTIRFPILNTYNMIGKNLLLLSDNTSYRIANIYNSNKFIAIDQLHNFDLPNVEWFDIAKFEDNPNTIEDMLTIFNTYKEYAIQ